MRSPEHRAESRRRTREAFTALHDPTSSSPVRKQARDELVRLHLGLVELCARRFRGRGEALEDLEQVGTIGLLSAIDRFDPAHGTEFTTYATPTIVGEIKRHFRDRSWSVRVPRRLQELRGRITDCSAELTHDLGRAPTPREIAARLEVELADVVEALESGHARTALSLDRPAGDEREGPSILDTLGAEDSSLDGVEVRTMLRPLIAGLPHQQREVLSLRFFDELSQAQIAERIGVSQMHVSRLLRRTLEGLQRSLGDD